MNRKLLLFLFVSFGCIYVDGTLEIKLPPGPFNFVTRITNTTFGLVRGGLGLFSRTVDRVINTFTRVEDRLRELLEEFRKQIVRGIPELHIPILDPLHIDNVEFKIKHESGNFVGNASDVTIRHISKFVLDDVRFSDIGAWRFKLDLNITLPFITAEGFYFVDALIGDTVSLFGNGKFWAKIYQLELKITALLKLEGIRPRVNGLGLKVKMKKLENNFEGLMKDKETGDLYNRVISRLAPEAVDMLWPELKKPIEKQIMNYINSALDNTSVATIVRRLFNLV
ncbi:uncharacterized protein LOC123315769 [Coccinella septempunctata]|uniref:uncharacterized protein LOC123315769 n=1 Tax=Coccinella septempunctata TaxID=41139 RepID=UPI001D05CE86|nr:uncharacterized protein LOC123315769 [Coccinella septempunctata]